MSAIRPFPRLLNRRPFWYIKGSLFYLVAVEVRRVPGS